MPQLGIRGRLRALALTLGITTVVGTGVLAGRAFAQQQTGGDVAANATRPAPSAATIAPLVETQNAFAAVAASVTPAVVSIQIEGVPSARPQQLRQLPGFPEFPGFPGFPGFPQERGRQRDGGESHAPRTPRDQQLRVLGSGSGFIVSKDGYILTNNHVVAEAQRLKVILPDRREFTATVVGRDPTTDVAVIKIDGHDLPTVSLGNDEAARVGDWVLAIGNPLGLNFTVTQGIISAKGRVLGGLAESPYAVMDYIQTDAPINPGNSGGPLVNVRGEVIGINSAIASPTGSYAGYGFAIPVTLVRDVTKDLMAYGHVRRGVLGLQLAEVRQRDAEAARLAQAGVSRIRGALVASFPAQMAVSPARDAGVRAGDVIVAANGQAIDHVAQLQRIVREFKPGESVTLSLVRDGARKDVRVRLAEAPREEPPRVAQGEPDQER